MDRVAETARLVGGFTFTGTSRHFVQYRDAAAPFGYDASQLLATNAALALYHDKFTQMYETERAIDLRALLLRLMPHVDPSTTGATGLRFLVAEQGLGPALVHYFVRSQVEGEVAVGEWPPASAFEEGIVRRYILRVPELPARMRPLMQSTPGITVFLPAGPGVAVEIGYRHPVALRACPVFDPAGLVLLRGRGDEPWALPKMPQMGDLRAFARIELRSEELRPVAVAMGTSRPDPVNIPLRLLPSTGAWKNVAATFVPLAQLPLLRRLAYALPAQTIARTRIALTAEGAFIRSPQGIESIPLGTFFVEVHAGLFVPAGYDVMPAVAPEVLFRALGSPSGHAVFLSPRRLHRDHREDGEHGQAGGATGHVSDVRAVAIEESAFAPLETSLVEAMPWEPLVAETIELTLAEKPAQIALEPLGAFPLGDASLPKDEGAPANLPPAPSAPALGP